MVGIHLVVAVALWAACAAGAEAPLPVLLVVLQVASVVPAAPFVFVGASRWADPSLPVRYTKYESRTAHVGGEQVQITSAEGSATTRYTPKTAILLACVGLGFWLLFAGLGVRARVTMNDPEGRAGGPSDPAALPTGAPATKRTRSN